MSQLEKQSIAGKQASPLDSFCAFFGNANENDADTGSTIERSGVGYRILSLLQNLECVGETDISKTISLFLENTSDETSILLGNNDKSNPTPMEGAVASLRLGELFKDPANAILALSLIAGGGSLKRRDVTATLRELEMKKNITQKGLDAPFALEGDTVSLPMDIVRKDISHFRAMLKNAIDSKLGSMDVVLAASKRNENNGSRPDANSANNEANGKLALERMHDLLYICLHRVAIKEYVDEEPYINEILKPLMACIADVQKRIATMVDGKNMCTEAQQIAACGLYTLGEYLVLSDMQNGSTNSFGWEQAIPLYPDHVLHKEFVDALSQKIVSHLSEKDSQKSLSIITSEIFLGPNHRRRFNVGFGAHIQELFKGYSP